MAHTKAKGSTQLGRDSQRNRLGVKRFAGQVVQAGEVLIRQRGSKWYAGDNTRRGGDDTINAMISGVVKFTQKGVKLFDGSRSKKTFVHVVKAEPKPAVKN